MSTSQRGRQDAAGELGRKEEKELSDFISLIPLEIGKFNEAFGFQIKGVTGEPTLIDGQPVEHPRTRFLLIRENPLLPEQTYCLYSILRGAVLHGYVGTYRDNTITSVKELKPLTDFTKGREILYDWLRQLLHASCEKIII